MLQETAHPLQRLQGKGRLAPGAAVPIGPQDACLESRCSNDSANGLCELPKPLKNGSDPVGSGQAGSLSYPCSRAYGGTFVCIVSANGLVAQLRSYAPERGLVGLATAVHH